MSRLTPPLLTRSIASFRAGVLSEYPPAFDCRPRQSCARSAGSPIAGRRRTQRARTPRYPRSCPSQHPWHRHPWPYAASRASSEQHCAEDQQVLS